MDVLTVDCGYIFDQFAAAYLIIKDNRALLIETNTERSIPLIEAKLEEQGLTLKNIELIFLTHAHLDHAGGAGSLMKRIPGATLIAHPKAIGHLVDPKKLVNGAMHVYGQDRFERLYGKVIPVELQRTRAIADQELVHWNGLEFKFLHTRGHANHHCCVVETKSKTIFTGDSFGLRYPVLQEKGLFIFPTTSPTGYEPLEAIKTVEMISGLNLHDAYPTHFGCLEDISGAAKQLRSDLIFSGDIVEKAANSSLPQEELIQYCLNFLTDYFRKRIESLGLSWDGRVKEILQLDLELNAAGMAVAASFLRKI